MRFRWSEAARVGLVVVLAVFIVWGINWGIEGGGPGYGTLYVAFDDARGVREKSEVRMQGVAVGEVASVRLARVSVPADSRVELRDRAILELHLSERALPTLPPRMEFRIVGSLIGFTGPHVEIVPVEAPRGMAVTAQAGRSADRPLPGGADAAPGMEELTPKAERLLDNVNRLALQMSELTRNLNRVAGNREMQQNLFAMTESFTIASRDLAELARQGPAIARNVEAGSRHLPRIARNFEAGSRQFGALLSQFQQTASRLDRTLAQTDQVMTEFHGMAGEFRGAASELHAAARESRPQLGAMLQQVQEGLRTLNATLTEAQGLIADPALRQHVQATGANLAAATESLKQVGQDVQGITGDPDVQNDLRQSISLLRQTAQEALAAFQQVNRLLGGGGDTIEGLRRNVGATAAHLTTVYDGRKERARAAFDATVPWFNDTYWRLGIFDAGRANRFNAQYGQPLGYGERRVRDVYYRYGLHASHLGLGFDWGDPRRPRLSADLYNIRSPRFDLQGSLKINRWLDATIGLDDLFDRPSPMVGVRTHRLP